MRPYTYKKGEWYLIQSEILLKYQVIPLYLSRKFIVRLNSFLQFMTMANNKHLLALILMALCGCDCSAKISLNTLLQAVEHHNKWVKIMCDEKEIEFSSSDFFNINQESDTVFILIEPVQLGFGRRKDGLQSSEWFDCSIWSRTDSVFIEYSNTFLKKDYDHPGLARFNKGIDEVSSINKYIEVINTKQREENKISWIDKHLAEMEADREFPGIYTDYGYIPGNFRPEYYERELLSKWDLDSIDILASYNVHLTLTYDQGSYCNKSELYRFIIHDGEYSVDYYEYVGYPGVPDYLATPDELEKRKKIRNDLLKKNPDEYDRLYNRKRIRQPFVLPAKQ